MRRLRLLLSSLVALALAASCTDTPTAPDASGARPLLDMSAAAAADPVSFCNPAQIIIPDPQPFIPAPIPVPSTIDVSGIGSDPFKVTVTLRGFTHPIGNDVDILIVGPTGVKVMLVSDAGQATNNVTLTLDDNASSSLPPGGPILSGTYKPTNFGGGDAIPGGNPPGPYGSLLSGFAGTDPNGTWKLYVWDDTPAASGSISAGWCVNITTLTVPVANAGGPYTVVEGSPITFDGTGSADAGNDIMSYAWNFGDGTTGTGPTPQHTYENMGSYTVTLVVTDAAGATDDATTSVTVLNVPGTAESFCNPAPITIRDANAALPYPSTVTVANAITGPFKITVTVKGINHTILFDLDMLLAGPAGQTVMLMSDADGGADLQNATLTFDDASSPIPATPGAILPSGSYKPTNIGSPDAMPAGAPAEPYGSSLGVFLGTDPNGTWRLLLRDDVLGGGNGSVTGGWCVNIVPTNAAPVANAGGPYSGAEGSPITFDGTGSTDPDNDIVSYAWDFGDGESGSGATVEHTYANSGTYTVTLVVTDDDGAPDDATALVTVADVAPTATFNAPTEVSEGSVATISLTSPSAADARFAFDCGSGYGAIGTASSDGCPAGDNGPMTVKGRVIDATIDDLFSEFTAEINVTNVAPTATFAHNGPVSEGTPIQLQLMNPIDVAADLAAGLTYAFDCGSGYGATSAASNASCLTTDNGDVQVKGKVIDKDGGEREYSAIVSVTNVAPVVTSLVLPSGPVAVNTPVTLGAAFSDVGTGDTHAGSFELGAGGPIASASVAESDGSGSMSASVSFAQPGVYTIIARVTDDDGATGSRSSAADAQAYVVVYDPTGSFVTGGGWISSLAGAYVADPTFTGKASFGFVAKYLPGANKPSGNTEFQFKAGSLNFKSTSYEWLVVSAAHAKYKGEGTINGGGSYGFMLTAVDGDLPGGGDADGFRIKIWELASGAVVYDNRMGEGDDADAATTLGGGSIVIHR